MCFCSCYNFSYSYGRTGMTTDITTDYSDYSTSSEGETVLDGFSTAANASCSEAACASRYPYTCTVSGTAPGSPLSQVWSPFFQTNLKLNATWFPTLNVTEHNTLCVVLTSQCIFPRPFSCTAIPLRLLPPLLAQPSQKAWLSS